VPITGPLDPLRQHTGGQLITGAGPGGGPHVEIWSFSPNGDAITNNGVQNSFFAFDPKFRGGVNVAFGSVIASPLSSSDTPAPTQTAQSVIAPGGAVYPGVYDYFPTPNPGTLIRPETSANTSPANTELLFSPKFPLDPHNLRAYSSQIIVSMASRGNEVRVFADDNPINFTTGRPSIRNAVGEINLVAAFVDSVTVTDPFNPLGGFTSTALTTNFNRVSDPGYNGGFQVFTTAFNFEGSANTKHIGTHPIPITPDGGLEINPVLAQTGIVNASLGTGLGVRNVRVRLFNQVSPMSPISSSLGADGATYTAYDEFDPFPGIQATGANASFGFGSLPDPGLDLVVLPQIAIATVTNPILLTP